MRHRERPGERVAAALVAVHASRHTHMVLPRVRRLPVPVDIVAAQHMLLTPANPEKHFLDANARGDDVLECALVQDLPLGVL